MIGRQPKRLWFYRLVIALQEAFFDRGKGCLIAKPLSKMGHHGSEKIVAITHNDNYHHFMISFNEIEKVAKKIGKKTMPRDG